MPAKDAAPAADPNRFQDRLARAQVEYNRAAKGHDAAEEKLVELKAVCLKQCSAAAALTAAAGESGDAQSLARASFDEEETHADHAEELEDAYRDFGLLATAENRLARARLGVEFAAESNPAKAGEVTQLQADLKVHGDTSARLS
jgi:hypothetical protein